MKFKDSTLTIIVPIYNEELVINRFLGQLYPVVNELGKKQDCRVLFVNNGSTDKSFELIKSYKDPIKNFGILTLARNFGYETALIAGLTHSDSDFYALCDGDGEDPVNLLLDFQTSILDEFNIAIGIRKNRVESIATKSFRSFGYSLLSKLGDDPFRKNAGNFSMFSKNVRNAILSENNSYPFLRSTLSRTGFKLKEFPHNRNPRIDGKSKYRKISLIKFAIAGFMTTTTWPLRFISYIGAFNSVALAIFLVVRGLGHGEFLVWDLVLALLVELIVFLGINSLYLARIYKNSLGRPLFYVDWRNSISQGNFKFVGKIE